jgi:hypothetical protein
MLNNVLVRALDNVQRLLDRRQSTTSFYLSVNTGILAVIGLLVKDAQMQAPWLVVSIVLLLIAGLIACWIWRSLLYQYEILLDWWYARLRELEESLPEPARLVTREYQDLYLTASTRSPMRRLGMTRRELALNAVFMVLYGLFAVGLLVTSLL